MRIFQFIHTFVKGLRMDEGTAGNIKRIKETTAEK